MPESIAVRSSTSGLWLYKTGASRFTGSSGAKIETLPGPILRKD
jgi:hypothetical protein